ncbi:hypothetical protein FACS1894172_04820 [Spirochaetia bacterium]|nr:hypothetical protein FACS1894172_04820 [Spirochaetia bacterium]
MKQEIAGLETKLDDLKTYAVPDEYAKLLTDYTALKTEVNTLDADLNTGRAEIAGAQSDPNLANADAFKNLAAHVDDLDRQLAALKQEMNSVETISYGGLGSMISQLRSEVDTLENNLNQLGDYPIPDRLPQLISDFGTLKTNVANLESDFALGQRIEKDLADPKHEDITQLVKDFNDANVQYLTLKNDVAQAESFGYNELGAAIRELQAEITGMENDLNRLGTYAVPDQFAQLITDFGALKDDVADLEWAFILGQNVQNSLTATRLESGSQLIKEFGDARVQYAALQNDIANAEAFGYNELGLAINALSAELNAFDSNLDQLYKASALTDDVIIEFAGLREGVEYLEQDFTLGREMRDDLGVFAKVDRGVKLVSDFNALDNKFTLFKADLTALEAAGFDELGREIAELERTVIGLETQFDALYTYVIPEDAAKLTTEFVQLKRSVADLEEAFVIGDNTRSKLGIIVNDQPGPEMLAEYIALKNQYAILKDNLVKTEALGFDLLADAVSGLGQEITELELDLSIFLDEEFSSPKEINEAVDFAKIERDVRIIDGDFIVLNDVFNGLGEFKTADKGDALFNDFTAMRVEFRAVKDLVDGLDSEIAYFSRLYGTIDELKRTLNTLEVAYNALLDYYIPDEFPALVTSFSDLKKNTQELENAIANVKKDLGSFTKLRISSNAGGLETEYGVLKDAVVDAEAYGFSEINSNLQDLQHIVIGLEVALDELTEYVIPEDFTILIQDFASVKNAVNDLEYAFSTGRYIRSGMGEFAKTAPGPELIAQFTALEQEYSLLKNAIAGTESFGGNVAADAVYALEDRFIALGDYFIPDEFNDLIKDFSALKADIGWFDGALATIKSELGPDEVERVQPGLEPEYDSFKAAIADAEAVGFEELQFALDDLSQSIWDLETKFEALGYYAVPDQFAELVTDFAALKTSLNSLEDSFVIGNDLKAGLGVFAGVQPGAGIVSSFNALSAEYATLKNTFVAAEAYGFGLINSSIDDLESAIKGLEAALVPLVLSELVTDAERNAAVNLASLAQPVTEIEGGFAIGTTVLQNLGEFEGTATANVLINRFNILKVEFAGVKEKIEALNRD